MLIPINKKVHYPLTQMLKRLYIIIKAIIIIRDTKVIEIIVILILVSFMQIIFKEYDLFNKC